MRNRSPPNRVGSGEHQEAIHSDQVAAEAVGPVVHHRRIPRQGLTGDPVDGARLRQRRHGLGETANRNSACDLGQDRSIGQVHVQARARESIDGDGAYELPDGKIVVRPDVNAEEHPVLPDIDAVGADVRDLRIPRGHLQRSRIEGRGARACGTRQRRKSADHIQRRVGGLQPVDVVVRVRTPGHDLTGGQVVGGEMPARLPVDALEPAADE